ncbi:hypothetical protein Tco_0138662 [Tanacetum coccineum]
MEAHLAPKQHVQVNKISSSCEICSGPHDTQYCMENPEQAFVDYASSRTDKVGGKQFTMNQGPRNFNEAANAWKEKPNFNWALTQTFTSLQNGSFSTYSPSYQTKLEKELSDFDSPSLEEPNRNPSSPKHVHFINSIDILSKESEAKEEGSVKPNAAEYKDHKRLVEVKEEVEEENEEELAEETEEETEEEEEEEDDP